MVTHPSDTLFSSRARCEKSLSVNNDHFPGLPPIVLSLLLVMNLAALAHPASNPGFAGESSGRFESETNAFHPASTRDTHSPALKITGIVFDQSNGKVIPDANIVIEESGAGTASGDGGFFVLSDMHPGEYTVTVSVIGYEFQNIKVKLTTDKSIKIPLQPQPVEFAPVVVTATGTERLLSELPHSAEILTEHRLSVLNGNTAGEKLESMTGIFSNTYDGLAGLQTPSIRGSNGDQVVVLMDGIRMNTAQGGGVDLNLFPSGALNRIEVVRGAHSALLGSDAIGGAIHLHSKELNSTTPLALSLNSTMGSFGTQMLQAFASGQRGPLFLFLTYNQMESDGNFEYADPNSGKDASRLNNDYKGENLFAKLGYTWNVRHQTQLVFQSLNTTKGAAGSINPGWDGLPMLTPQARSRYDRQLISLISKNQLSDRFRLRTQVSRQVFDYAYQNPAGWIPVDDLHENSSTQITLHGTWSAFQSLSIAAGIESRQDQLTSTQVKAENRAMTGAYLQGDWKTGLPLRIVEADLTVIPAVRYDAYSDVDGRISPQVGVRMATGESLRLALKGNAGLAYRLPTFNDLYWPEDDYTRGNPDLKPESSTNVDVGLQLSGGDASFYQAEFTVFKNQVEDLINWAPTPENEFQWMPTNVGKAKLSGIESTLSFTLQDNMAHFRFTHTRLNATDESTGSLTLGKTLIYRPRDKLDVTAGIRLFGIQFNINYRRVSKRFVSADNSVALDAYSLLNANMGTDIAIVGLTIRPRIQVMNLLDESIFVTDGYPLPGRELRVSVGLEY